MRRAAAIGFVIAAAMATALGGGVVGCHEGNGLGAADMTEVDLLPPADLVPPVDLVPPPNCGKIVFCALGCLGGGGIPGVGGGTGGGGDMSGANPVGCVLGCGQNAPPAEVQAALGLIVCAAQNCLSGDGGTGGLSLGVIQCLQMSCPSQLTACHGLGISG